MESQNTVGKVENYVFQPSSLCLHHKLGMRKKTCADRRENNVSEYKRIFTWFFAGDMLG
jgi:hypothetical protein